MRFRFAAALGLAALLTISCGGVTDPSKNQVETFTGTVTPGGTSAIFPFKASNSGEFTIVITQLSPITNTVLGTIFGQPQSDGSCAIINENTFSVLNSPALSGAIIPGSYCVALFDVGALSTTETFTLSVSHP